MTTKEKEAALAERLRESKQIEETVQAQVDAWTPDAKAIAFQYLRALGWSSDRAHAIKVRLGLTQ